MGETPRWWARCVNTEGLFSGGCEMVRGRRGVWGGLPSGMNVLRVVGMLASPGAAVMVVMEYLSCVYILLESLRGLENNDGRSLD